MADERQDLPVPGGRDGRDDPLERAAAALRDAPVPDGPPADVLDRTLRALNAAEGPVPAPQTNSKRRWWTMKSLSKFAAAAVFAVVAAGLIFWAVNTGGSNVALADVLSRIRDVRAVKFNMVSTVEVPGAPPQTVSGRATIAEPGWMRQEIDQVGIVSVFDFRTGRAVTLVPKEKTAIVLELSNLDKLPGAQAGPGAPGRPPNILDELKKLDGSSGKPVGELRVDGRVLKGFRVEQPGQEMTIWVDPETRLPVEITAEMKTGMLPSAKVKMTGFVWDASVDPSQLTLTPPADYKVQNLSVDVAPPTERDLLTALRTAAELNGGTFPDGFDMEGMMKVIKGAVERMPADRQSPERKDAETKGAQSMITISRGWMFASDPKNGEDFHYAGTGARLGTAGVPVFWYRPKDAKVYRVIDADLRVRDVAPADLPKVASQPVKPLTAMPAATGLSE